MFFQKHILFYNDNFNLFCVHDNANGKEKSLIFPLEAVFKPQIRFKSKAQADEKAQHTLVCEHFEEACNAAIEP